MFSAINAHVVAQLTAATSSASDVAQLAAIYRRCQARSRRHTLRARDVATSGVAAPHARCHAHQCREVTATDRSRACECLAYSLSGASAHHRCRRRLSLSRRANPHRRAAVCRFRRRSSTVSGSASRASVRACVRVAWNLCGRLRGASVGKCVTRERACELRRYSRSAAG
jgi:hypothetical protein